MFASSVMGFWAFLAFAVCSLPRQLVIVYTNVLFEDEANGTSTKIEFTPVTVAFAIIILITYYGYLLKEMKRVTPEIICQRRKARQAKNSKDLSAVESPAAD
ncbi:hypothetical protein GYMLUDRAFT_95113 [Collybiopsis luxurians FD-317 M1]|uniref:Dolichol phosphate-mannose biosynthesis regulatory protein n=1 Tax=Collybiopsis luxurians FD-317 M1 TaxID=944289 RepID=A0A0D0C7S1_9AGAR|nr:hypothetical protein GYMLUDRAFT_95113 [Collybiopsis luxurians FD-317 M1]